MSFDASDVQIYAIGVCVGAMGLWLYLAWRNENLTGVQWALAFAAILFWPILFAFKGLIRIVIWVKYRYALAQDYRSPDRR